MVRFLPIASDGQLDLSQLDTFLTPKTRIVAMAAISNVLGA